MKTFLIWDKLEGPETGEFCYGETYEEALASWKHHRHDSRIIANVLLIEEPLEFEIVKTISYNLLAGDISED